MSMSDATNEQHERLGKGYPYTLRPELHKALKARGIDYWVAQGLTFWNCPDGRECVAYGYQSNGKPSLAVKIVGITDPAQAIAATLGSDDTFTREDVEGAFVSGYSLGLDMFDNSKPDNEKGWNQNERDMDEEMECVEYAPRWKFDPRRMAVIVDRQAWEEIRASLKQLTNDYIVLHMFAEELLGRIDQKLLVGELGDKARELEVIK